MHVNAVVELLRKHGIDSASGAKEAIRNPAFQEDAKQVGLGILRQESGKLGAKAMLAILGAALGTIGIEELGSAIGFPLASVAALAGIFFGDELNSGAYAARIIRGFCGLF